MEWKVKIDDIQGARLEQAKVEALRKIAEQFERLNNILDKVFLPLMEEMMEELEE